MRTFIGGIAAVLAVLGGYSGADAACGSCASCSSCGGAAKQTIRITAGNKSDSYVVGTPRAVSNTDVSGGAVVAPTIRLSTGGGTDLRYVGETSGTGVGARMPNDYAVRNADNGGHNVVATEPNEFDYRRTQDWAPAERADNYAPNQSYRQPTTRAQSGYQQPNNYYYADDYRGSYDDPRGGEAHSYDWSGLWYVGAHLDLNLLSWGNKYHATPVAAISDESADHDDYKFKPVIGGNIFAGYRFDSHWRTDLEFGFTSRYSDSGGGLTFELSVPYLTVNGYYDIPIRDGHGLYLGAGLGVAFPTISMEWAYFTGSDSDKTGTTFTAAAMFGYSYYLSDALVLDLRLRVSGMDGPSITRSVAGWGDLESLKTDVGFIFNSAISVGFRYEF